MSAADLTHTRPGAWAPSLPALVVTGLFGVAAGFAVLAVPDAPPLLGITAGMLTFAAVAALPRRWAAPAAGLLGAVLVLIGSLAQPFTAYHLGRPWTADFAATLVLLAGGIVAGAAGAAAALQATSLPDRRDWRRPAWGAALVTGLIGVVAGATVAGTVAYGAAPAGTDLSEADAETVVADGLAFMDVPDRVRSGELVLELRNDGDIEHDFVIEDLDGAAVVVAVARPGGTARGAVELAPGTYTYYCSVPGHREAGMEGTLTVTS